MLVANCILLLLCILGVASPSLAQPNIILILTDDQRADTLPYMPHVSAIAEGGVSFTNAFVTTPLCGPSRASLYSGLTAHTLGITGNRPPYGGMPLFDHASSIAPALQAAGYTTALFGKYMNAADLDPLAIPPGWNEWHAFIDDVPQPLSFRLNENGAETWYTAYQTDVLRDKVLAFMAAAPQPYFIVFAPFMPHSPAIPAPRHVGTYAALPPTHHGTSWEEADIREKPAYWQMRRSQWSPTKAAQVDQFRIDQLESLLAIDEAVHAIHTTMPYNTNLIYTSDNGMTWGEHWDAYMKRQPYDEALRVPLFITGPTVVQHEEDRIAINIDLAPTLAAWAGISFPAEGAALTPLLNASSAPWRTDFLAEGWNNNDPSRPPTFQAVVQTGWKYINTCNPGCALHEELYDRRVDRFETTDRKATSRTQLKRMRDRLLTLTQ